MSDEKTTKDYFRNLVEGLNYIAEHLDGFKESIKRDAEEMKKLRDENANIQTGFYQMIERSGFDISPCRNCGESLVCVPEGLALCKTCATKGGDA